MAKDDDELIRKFQALISYLPVIRPAPMQPTLTHPPPWAVGVGVAQPVPTLTGPLPPWPISITIAPEMFRVYDWLDQHHDQRDTDEYRAKHDWLAEQMGLSPDTLEPSCWSNPNPNAEFELPAAPPSAPELGATLAATEAPDTASFTAEAASVGTLAAIEVPDTVTISGVGVIAGALDAAEVADSAAFAGASVTAGALDATEAADTAAFIGQAVTSGVLDATEPCDTEAFAGIGTGVKKRKPGAGNKPKFTDEEIRQLRDALDRKIDGDPKQGSYKNARDFLKHHVVPKIMKAREVAKVDTTEVSDSTLDRCVIRPVRDARRERSLAFSK